MEIVTGSTGVAHVTPIDDAVRNVNMGYLSDKVVFSVFRSFEAAAITANEVRVYGGYGMNQGRLFKIPESEYDSLTIENGAQGLKRADLIVARYTMNVQTGFEDISLVVIKGQSGQEYVDPEYVSGNINSGATQDDFPLYRVKLNGIVIEAVESMFTLLPSGGRVGRLEELLNLLPVSNGGTGKASFTTGSALIGNGTGALTEKAIDTVPTRDSNNLVTSGGVALALEEGGYGDMLKGTYDPDNDGIIAIAQGGTGKTSWTQGKVLVGNGTGIPTERAIDSTSGGTTNSNALITSGAVKSKISEMQATFQDGVDTIYNAIVRNGVTPSSSTPNACATGIDNVYQKGKTDAEAVTWTEMLNPTFVGKNSGTVSTKIENYLELRVSLANVVNFKITGMSNISIENSGYPEVDITYYNGSTEIGTAAIYELNKNFTPPNNATEMKLQAWSNVGQVGIGGQVTSSYVMMLTKRAKKLR